MPPGTAHAAGGEVRRVGIVGGGQLGRMLTLAAHPLGLAVTVLDPDPGCPAAQVGATQIVGRLDDPAALAALSAATDVVTWEIEHIDADALVALEAGGVLVRPSPSMLAAVQDKFAQKQLLAGAGIAVAATVAFPPLGASAAPDRAAFLVSLVGRLGDPVVVKARRGGFDGRGNHVLSGGDPDALGALTATLGDDWSALYAEASVPFVAEVAVIVARDAAGATVAYPTLRTVQEGGICHTVSVPAGLDPAIDAEAQDLGRRTVALLDGPGVFAVEMFVTPDAVVVNEIAPRVHNSGHLTIEAAATSQFEQHVRAVAGLPLGPTTLRTPAAVMVNVLGRREGPAPSEGLGAALALPDTHVHLYGKTSYPQRKIGHVTALGADAAEVAARALAAREALRT
jgi:5-(carboxyamino)imidazole ribonucleotide synthase